MRTIAVQPSDERRADAFAAFHWYGVSDVVAQLGTRPNGRPVASDSTVREWIRTGRLKAKNFGTGKRPLYRISPEAFEEFIAAANYEPDAA